MVKVSYFLIFFIILENEVDITALELLNYDQIKHLIPVIGPQAKFKKALVDWKLTLQNKVSDDYRYLPTPCVASLNSILS